MASSVDRYNEKKEVVVVDRIMRCVKKNRDDNMLLTNLYKKIYNAMFVLFISVLLIFEWYISSSIHVHHILSCHLASSICCWFV